MWFDFFNLISEKWSIYKKIAIISYGLTSLNAKCCGWRLEAGRLELEQSGD